MTIQQTIQQKLPQLPLELQQELLDFMEFLLSKKNAQHPSKQAVSALKIGRMSPNYLPPSKLESPDAPSVYQGKPLTLEDMQAAIDEEARQHL